MKRFAWLILCMALLAIPSFAQDEDGGGSDGDDFFSGDIFGAPADSAPRVDPLVDLRSWLARANAAPLEKKQEKPLNKLYEKEVKNMAKAFEKRFGVSLESAMASQTPARGRRGALSGRPNPEHAAEIRRMSDQLINKIIAGLRIDQQAALRKYQSEQLRVRRLSVMTKSMSSAGLLLTPAQTAQIEALYARESRLRTLIIVEAKGEPHQVKVAQLETQTTQRVVQLLDQTQKAALAEAIAKSSVR